MEYEIRTVQPEELPTLIALEQECFGDSEADARLILQQFTDLRNIWVSVQGDRVVSMALTVPVTFADREGAYLYALGTRGDARNRGSMHALIQHIKIVAAPHRKWSFLCLIPANPQLFDFYEKMGFVPAFSRRRYTLPIRRNLLAVAEFDSVTLPLLLQLRKKCSKIPCVQLEAKSLAAVMTDYYSCGGSSVQVEGGYGFFRKNGDTLVFDELFAQDEQSVQKLLQACREKTGCSQAIIFAGDEALLWFGSGSYSPYGMVCTLNGGKMPVGYMGLMLESYGVFDG